MKGEALEQSIIFAWASMQENVYPELKLMFAIPNGGYRNKLEAKNLKLQGVKSGVPDIFLSYPKDKFHGLYIELKHGKNKTSENQNKWLTELNKAGYKAVVAYEAEEAIKTIKEYLGVD